MNAPVTAAMAHCEAIVIDGEMIQVRPDAEHDYLMESRQVAKGYGVSETLIRKHKLEHADELLEGRHWGVRKSNTLGGPQKKVFWTKRGIIRLGFFIKSERAKRFRDAAEDLILHPSQTAQLALPTSIDQVRLARLERAVEQLSTLHLVVSDLRERIRPRPVHHTPEAVPSPPPPAPLLLKPGRPATGRTHRSKGYSMPLALIAQIEARAMALKMNRSVYVRTCVELEMTHALLGHKEASKP